MERKNKNHSNMKEKTQLTEWAGDYHPAMHP